MTTFVILFLCALSFLAARQGDRFIAGMAAIGAALLLLSGCATPAPRVPYSLVLADPGMREWKMMER